MYNIIMMFLLNNFFLVQSNNYSYLLNTDKNKDWFSYLWTPASDLEAGIFLFVV
jgi:hypothetical protein